MNKEPNLQRQDVTNGSLIEADESYCCDYDDQDNGYDVGYDEKLKEAGTVLKVKMMNIKYLLH